MGFFLCSSCRCYMFPAARRRQRCRHPPPSPPCKLSCFVLLYSKKNLPGLAFFLFPICLGCLGVLSWGCLIVFLLPAWFILMVSYVWRQKLQMYRHTVNTTVGSGFCQEMHSRIFHLFICALCSHSGNNIELLSQQTEQTDTVRD